MNAGRALSRSETQIIIVDNILDIWNFLGIISRKNALFFNESEDSLFQWRGHPMGASVLLRGGGGGSKNFMK